MDDFLGIAIVGAGLSLVIELVRSKLGSDSRRTKALTLVLAVAVGSAYYFARQTVYWQTVLGVLASASTVYALFVKKPSKTEEKNL